MHEQVSVFCLTLAIIQDSGKDKADSLHNQLHLFLKICVF